jgi:hypothetical protein
MIHCNQRLAKADKKNLQKVDLQTIAEITQLAQKTTYYKGNFFKKLFSGKFLPARLECE